MRFSKRHWLKRPMDQWQLARLNQRSVFLKIETETT